jgi:hypothetical protein
MHPIRAIIVEREMPPGDQAVVAFVVAVFVIFSAAMVYATCLGGRETPSEKKKEK